MMESRKHFMVRGQKSLLAVPATRRFSMMAPSPMRTPVNIRSHAASYCAILDELSNTKSRIFKILEDYEEDRMNDDRAVLGFDGIRRSSDVTCSSSEGGNNKALLSLRDSLKKQLNEYIKDDYKVTEDVPSTKEFSSAMDTTHGHIRELDTINSKILEIAKSKAVPQLDKSSDDIATGASHMLANFKGQENKQLLKMYTDEAMKAAKLKRLIDEQDTELRQVRASYEVLSEKNKKQYDQFMKTSNSLSEANKDITQLRTELSREKSKHKSQAKFSRSTEPTEASSVTHVIPQVTDADDDDDDDNDEITFEVHHKKDMEGTNKKQVTKAYAQKKAKSMEKHLTTMEEIIVHSSNQIKVSLKNKSELIMQLNLEIFELCHGMYSCINEAVESSIYLLGVKDTEKLLSLLQASTATWESKTKSNLHKESMGEYLKGMIDSTEKDAANISIELESFIKRKFKAYGKLLFKDIEECAIEIQNWLLKAIVEIQGNIQSALHDYHVQLEENEEQRSHELRNTIQKVTAASNELKKIMGQTNMQCEDYFIAINDGVKDLLNNLTNSKIDATVSSILQTQEKIFSTVNSLRSCIAGQLRQKYKINFCSSSWRSRSFHQKPNRKMSVASIHDFTIEKHKSVLQNQAAKHNKDLSYRAVSKFTSKSNYHRRLKQPSQTGHALLATRNYDFQKANSNNSNKGDHSIVPVQSKSVITLEKDSYSERYEENHKSSRHPVSHSEQVNKNLALTQTTRSYIVPSNLSVIEIAAQPRMKPQLPQSFRKTTQQERMQRYYKHIQTKYSGRTSLEPPKQRTSTSSLSLEGNSVDFMHKNSATPRAPIQRIGNFSYPNKAFQNSESSSGRSSTIMMYNSLSGERNCLPTFLPDASVVPKHHGKFSGNALPKWNQLYKAYHPSSK